MYLFVKWFTCSRASQVALAVKKPPSSAGDRRDIVSISLWEDPLEEEMATHSSILAWRIPWIEEPGGTQLKRLSTTLILMMKRAITHLY